MEREVRGYTVPHTLPSQTAQWHSGGCRPPYEEGVNALAPPHPGGYRPKIWRDQPVVARARPAERTCTAAHGSGATTQVPYTKSSPHAAQPFISHFLLLPLVPHHLSLSATYGAYFRLLLLPAHVSLHSRHWSIVCLEGSRVSLSSRTDVRQLPADWLLSNSPRPLFVSLPV